MLILAGSTHKLQAVSSAAANLEVFTDWIDMTNADPPAIVGSTSGNQLTGASPITTAATTDIVAAPTGSIRRNVKFVSITNNHASVSCDVTPQINVSGVLTKFQKFTLVPGACLEYLDGNGWYLVSPLAVTPILDNFSTGSATPFSSDTYLVGSSVAIPVGAPLAGTFYRFFFDVTKTGAGTATPIITVRIGTAGSTADTARCTFTYGAGSAAIDSGVFITECLFRTVGAGTSAVLQGRSWLNNNLASTGLSTILKYVNVTSSGFDSTVASSIIGASYNGGASAAHTIQLVRAELIV